MFIKIIYVLICVNAYIQDIKATTTPSIITMPTDLLRYFTEKSDNLKVLKKGETCNKKFADDIQHRIATYFDQSSISGWNAELMNELKETFQKFLNLNQAISLCLDALTCTSNGICEDMSAAKTSTPASSPLGILQVPDNNKLTPTTPMPSTSTQNSQATVLPTGNQVLHKKKCGGTENTQLSSGLEESTLLGLEGQDVREEATMESKIFFVFVKLALPCVGFSVIIFFVVLYIRLIRIVDKTELGQCKLNA